MDDNKLAAYPFLSKASEHVEALNISLEDMLHSRALESVRIRGNERVLQALQGEIRESDVHRGYLLSSARLQVELLSYPFSRILVSCVNDGYLIRRFALKEAESACDRLMDEDTVFLLDVAHDLGCGVELDGDFRLFFTDYLALAAGIREFKWKLVNQQMESGWVSLGQKDFVRLLQEAVRKQVSEKLPLDMSSEICKSLRSYLDEIREELAKLKSVFSSEGFGEVDVECMPPCMQNLLGNMQSGVNLPHSARFAVTSFLLSIGMKQEEVMQLYRSSPDFDENRTRYQVMHIAGAQSIDSSGSRYTPPACSTMATYGNCVGKDKICDRISHPLAYYRRKIWIKHKRQGDKTKGKEDGSED